MKWFCVKFLNINLTWKKIDERLDFMTDRQNEITRQINTIKFNNRSKEIDNGGSVSWIDSIKEKTLTIFNISKQN